MKRHLTTQDVSWFLDLNKGNRLDLNPDYQRRSVWSNNDRRYFLDTIFHNFPCPAIFLYKTSSDDGRPIYHVVDGKQRLETIIMFTENKIAIAKDFGDITLDGKKWKDLGADEKQRFWDYTLPVEMLSSVEGTLVNEVFDRFNRNSRKLERQELRHAKYDGWFITFAEDEAEKDEWQTFKIVTKARAKRMKDVQFISELMLVTIEGKIAGFDQDFLDEKYSEYDNPENSDEESDDVIPAFSKADFGTRWQETKTFLVEMENANQAISTFATTFMNFYTLWGVLSLENGIPTAEVTAVKFKTFMDEVRKVAKLSPNEDEVVADVSEDASKYYFGTQGANTDLSKRQSRHTALANALKG